MSIIKRMLGKSNVSLLQTGEVTIPSGTIFSFGGATVPSGWLICEGAAISRSTYADLFAALGSAWGSGDGSTTFNLPDLKGRFLRGRANGSTIDPDRASRAACNVGGNTGDAVGSVQVTATKTPTNAFTTASQSLASGTATSTGSDHTHSIVHREQATASSGSAISTSHPIYATTGYSWTTGSGQGTHSHGVTGTCPASTVNGGGDNDTRPNNAYVNYIIKV